MQSVSHHEGHKGFHRDTTPEHSVGLSSRRAPSPAKPLVGHDAIQFQTTLAQPIDCRGIALHSGLEVVMRLEPAPANSGIRFFRSDRPDIAPFAVTPSGIVDTRLSTVLASPDDASVRVATIEHLMAALHALEIDNALVSVDGPEIPVLDGSSESFSFLLGCAGTQTLGVTRQIIEIMRTVRVENDHGGFAELRPASRGLSLSMAIDFGAEAIGKQHYALTLTPERFLRELSFCRTFVYRQDIEALQKIGLARGGSLENAIVVDGAEVLNPAGLRVGDEFVRHKLLDAVGDLYCAGHRIRGKFIGNKSGHDVNNRLLRALFAEKANWRFVRPTLPARMTARRPESVAA